MFLRAKPSKGTMPMETEGKADSNECVSLAAPVESSFTADPLDLELDYIESDFKTVSHFSS